MQEIPEIDTEVKNYVASHLAGEPSWIRVVILLARLAEPDGSSAAASTTVHRILVWDSREVRATYASGFGMRDAERALENKLQNVNWSELWIVADRDDLHSVDVVTDRPPRQLDDSATDPYYRQVHDYLELNRPEVDALVARLRAGGDLPGEAATTARDSGFPQQGGAQPMSVIDDADVDEYIAVITKDQPDWIRVVLWIGQLADPDGHPAGASTTVHRVIVHDSAGLRPEYGSTIDAYDAFRRMETSLEGVDWSELRIVVDRDGQRDIDVVTDVPLRPEEDSGNDPYFDQVHDYLELNRAEVDALVVRLRASGDLPGEAAPVERRRGVLGNFRRDG